MFYYTFQNKNYLHNGFIILEANFSLDWIKMYDKSSVIYPYSLFFINFIFVYIEQQMEAHNSINYYEYIC